MTIYLLVLGFALFGVSVIWFIGTRAENKRISGDPYQPGSFKPELTMCFVAFVCFLIAFLERFLV